MEPLPSYVPQALYSLGILLAGYGGHRYGRRNGNGWDGKKERRTEPSVTQRECELIHQGLNTRLDEGNQKMERLGTTLQEVNNNLMLLKGAHDGKKE